jgi:16S rRNA (uracil1498-N3)-methyltransferase
MHRILVATEALADDFPALGTDAARHLKVLRLVNGEKIELFDGCGRTREYIWDSGRLLKAGEIITHEHPAFPLTLFACVTKGSRWDWTIEKATELGVSRIVPVISERTIVRLSKEERAKKRERWQRIVEDAARQSDAKFVPEVLEARDFTEAVEMLLGCTCFVGALLSDTPKLLIDEALKRRSAGNHKSNIAIFVGPEGDFTEKELSVLIDKGVPTSFGANILRAETASVYALSILKSVFV